MLMINPVFMMKKPPKPKRTVWRWFMEVWDEVLMHVCCAPFALIWLIDSRIIDRDWGKILRGQRLDTD